MRPTAKTLVLALGAGGLAAQVPLGDPFPIHEFSVGDQERPDVAVQPKGRFVVVWESEGADGDGCGVRIRQFAGDGIPLTPELAVNQATAGNQVRPQVAADGQGNVVVVWLGPGSDGLEVFARHFGADATPLGDEFVVNVAPEGSQLFPDVARNAAGRFVVSWLTNETDEVSATVLEPPDRPVVPEFVVNDSGDHPASSGSAAGIRSDGGFVVAWTSKTDSSLGDVLQRRYSPAGVPLSGEFQVSQPDAGAYASDLAGLAVDSGDSFRVTWDRVLNLQDKGAYGRRTNAQGGTGPIQELVLGIPGPHSFSQTPVGDFVVVYTDGYFPTVVEGRRFSAGGTLLNEFPIAGPDWAESFHLSDDSRDLVLIRGNVSGDRDLYGERYGAVPIFADGFESGDTSAWDQAVL